MIKKDLVFKFTFIAFLMYLFTTVFIWCFIIDVSPRIIDSLSIGELYIVVFLLALFISAVTIALAFLLAVIDKFE